MFQYSLLQQKKVVIKRRDKFHILCIQLEKKHFIFYKKIHTHMGEVCKRQLLKLITMCQLELRGGDRKSMEEERQDLEQKQN